MKTKGQITMFIILGIVILFAIALLIYFYTIESVNVDQFPIELKQTTQLNLQACMKTALSEGIQNVELESNNNIEYKGKTYPLIVSLNPEFSITEGSITASNKPGAYPWTTFPFFEGNKIYKATSLFGWNNLPSYDIIKNSLSEQVQKSFDNCINNLPDNVITTISKIELTFEDKTILASIKQAKLNFQTTEATINNLLTQVNTEIKQLYSFTNNLVNEEITNIKSTPESSLDFIINLEKDNLKNTILKISSRTDKNLQFYFAIPNRYPALEYINASFFDHNNLLCPDSEINFVNNEIIISKGTPPVEICQPGEAALCRTLPDGSTVKDKHSCIQKTIQLFAKDPDDEEKDLTILVEPTLTNAVLPHKITKTEYDSQSSFDLTVKVDDGLLKDFQIVKLCMRGGSAC